MESLNNLVQFVGSYYSNLERRVGEHNGFPLTSLSSRGRDSDGVDVLDPVSRIDHVANQAINFLRRTQSSRSDFEFIYPINSIIDTGINTGNVWMEEFDISFYRRILVPSLESSEMVPDYLVNLDSIDFD